MKKFKNICNIAIKDFKAYFLSPIGYLVISLFIFIVGFMFYQRLIFFMQQLIISSQFGQAVHVSLTEAMIKPLYGTINLIFLFMIPLITMRLLSEEKKQKTIELLYTSPISNWQIVLGKYFASFFLVSILIISTLVFPLILYIGGNPDCWHVFVIYIGMSFVGYLYLSVGLFWSAITENQIVSAVLTFVSLLFLWLVNWLADSSAFGSVLSKLSINEHFNSFLSGTIDTADIIYFVSFIFFFLYLSSLALTARDWE